MYPPYLKLKKEHTSLLSSVHINVQVSVQTSALRLGVHAYSRYSVLPEQNLTLQDYSQEAESLINCECTSTLFTRLMHKTRVLVFSFTQDTLPAERKVTESFQPALWACHLRKVVILPTSFFYYYDATFESAFNLCVLGHVASPL